MITRALLSVAAVWICMPQHPDLGLPPAACTATPCVSADAGRSEREAILRRLHSMRSEIHSVSGVTIYSGERKDGEAALQKAGDLPGLVTRLDDTAGGMLAGERR